MIGTVLIVDDESLVRRTLRKMIESNETGWRVVAEASNGQEALEAIETAEPDLVITDVRMPRMSGIELAEAIHNRKKPTMVVILTGYKDFEYAQAALRFGVLDFLLKPCPEENVCDILRRLHNRLSEAKRSSQAEARAQEEATIRALFYRLPCDPRQVERLQPLYAGSTLGLIRVHDYAPAGKSYQPADLVILQFAIGNIIQEIADSYYEFTRVVLIRHDCFAVFYSRVLAPYRSLPPAHLFVEIDGKIKELLAIATSCDNIAPVDRLDRLPAPADAAGAPTQAAGARVEPGDGGDPPRAFTLGYAKLQTLESRFLAFIMLGQTELLLRDLEAVAGEVGGLPPEDARLEALACGVTLQAIARKHLGAPGYTFDLDREIDALHLLSDAAAVADWLRAETARFAGVLTRLAERKPPGVIERALEYVERHYMERCSLQDAAAHVYLNAKYFSDLFRRETGHGYIHHLTKVRMEKAAILLSNTDRKVTDISQAVGYDDSNYFSTVFRKEFGLSPGEYRKKRPAAQGE
ncbi:MAG: response regulator [Paenibacillaceae bacterium]|nr:response regulator [Paenibacillaceae bacterium]